MAKYDPVKQKDWQIAEIAEAEMIPFDKMCDKLEITKEERIPHGQKIGRVDYLKCLERLKNKPDGKYIEVTAITPTPLGEGKSTTSLRLDRGPWQEGQKCGRRPQPALRRPDHEHKGNGGGRRQLALIPMTEFSLGLTGDINDIMNAHNLAMVAAHLPHAARKKLQRRAASAADRMKRLDIDPTRVEMGWIMDFCAQALRNIIIGTGRQDGRLHDAVQIRHRGQFSELMAILSIVSDLADLKKRLNEITVAYDKQGNPVTTGDLEVGNAMTALMRNSINPTLM